MHVIAIAGSKGGVGKSTIATALAVRIAADYPMTALLDLDPSGDARHWRSLRNADPDAPPMLARGGGTLADVREALELNGYDFLIADLPPYGMEALAETVRAASLVLVPMRVSLFDAHASEPALSICAISGTPWAVVINAVPPKSTRGREAIEGLADAGIPHAPHPIVQRDALQAALEDGETGPERDPKAAEDIDNLWAYVRNRLGVKAKAKGGKRG